MGFHRMKQPWCALVSGVLIAVAGLAQQAAPLTFEVATIKPADPNDPRVLFSFPPNGIVQLNGASLKLLISLAYDVRDYQISGGPAWVSSDRFDVQAKPPVVDNAPQLPATMTPEQMRALQEQSRERLRGLLAERFQLVLRKEVKELPIYALVVAKGGPKLAESKLADAPARMMMGRGTFKGGPIDLDLLARHLSMMVGRPIINRTDLKGKFDVELKWAPESGGPGQFGPGGPGGPSPGGPGGGAASIGAGPGGGPSRPDAPSTGDPGGPTLFTAIQEQLGLRLESTKGPVETYLIEKAEKPSEN